MNKIDKDNNGNITKAELRAWMEYIQLKHLRDEVDERWSLIDEDGDGMISWDEFKQRQYGHKMGKHNNLFQTNVLNIGCEVKSLQNHGNIHYTGCIKKK